MKRDLGVTKDLDEKYEKLLLKYKPRVCVDFDIDNLAPILEKELGLAIPKNYSMLIDFANRFELNKSIWSISKATKQNYKVGLLTNQFPRMLALIKKRNLIPDIDWDAVVDSSVVRYQKPEEEIYKIAEEMSGLDSEKIFFIDNKNENLEVARKRGWKTFLYDPQSPEESSRRLSDILGLE